MFDAWAPRLLSLLTFVVPLIFCLDMADAFDLPKMTLVYTVDLLLAACWIRQSMTQGRLRFRRSIMDLPLLAFLASAGASTIFSIDPKLSFLGAYKIYVFGWMPLLAFAALYWFTVQAASDKVLTGVLRAAFYSGVLVGVYAGLQYFGHEIFQRMPSAAAGRVWSSLGNPLYMGALCMMALPLMHGLNGKVVPMAAPLSGAGLVLSLSRSAWLGAAAAMGCLFFAKLQSPKQRKFILWVLAVIVIGMMWMPAARQRASQMFSLSEGSNAARVAGWKAGLQVWKANLWLGSGTDTFLQAFRPYRSLEFVRAAGTGITQADAHNDFVQIAATQGLIGLVALLWLLIRFFKPVKDALSDPSRQGMAAALIALGIQNQFNFSSVATSAWAAVFAGLVAAKSDKREWVRPASLELSWFALALCPMGMWVAFFPVRADLAYRASQLWSQVSQPLKALYALEWAVHFQGRVDVYKTDFANILRTLATQSPVGPTRERYFDHAWKTADSAVRDHPANPDVWNNRGVAAMWMVQLAQRDLALVARESFERAIALDPVFVDAWANLAKWEHLAGHLEKEKELWRKVLEIDPTHPMALQVLGMK
ncbi:MAG: hypothetical protein A2992_07520 [Elusimicrobia bacterium RIFCSPLOWO2_01_FULL_59_12]|nr:MAG: hypothetical protein A2992_07520 [Elusimicrobia bacterium RIFCSPLOWO2_01_FULL_59_12]